MGALSVEPARGGPTSVSGLGEGGRPSVDTAGAVDVTLGGPGCGTGTARHPVGARGTGTDGGRSAPSLGGADVGPWSARGWPSIAGVELLTAGATSPTESDGGGVALSPVREEGGTVVRGAGAGLQLAVCPGEASGSAVGAALASCLIMREARVMRRLPEDVGIVTP